MINLVRRFTDAQFGYSQRSERVYQCQPRLINQSVKQAIKKPHNGGFYWEALFLLLCPSMLGLGVRSFEYSVSPVVIFISETIHSKQPTGRISCYFCYRDLPRQMEIIVIVICEKRFALLFLLSAALRDIDKAGAVPTFKIPFKSMAYDFLEIISPIFGPDCYLLSGSKVTTSVRGNTLSQRGFFVPEKNQNATFNFATSRFLRRTVSSRHQ
ncbi:hypothetical protein Q4551_12795 [Oceanobacter sp. 5_MG-2023]|uniref:hypothetical protein n=1 Tax=Oceanobacter sp. 5_MG-2023 TaxID=3062645 RepID=UPI0026E2BEA8|nr:hypothetical protein [Oceanobacter sp. 5_MG-2023]MDO6683165.1 hypothetical protein [Oceanobacter sp. 5_MG-2023]